MMGYLIYEKMKRVNRGNVSYYTLNDTKKIRCSIIKTFTMFLLTGIAFFESNLLVTVIIGGVTLGVTINAVFLFKNIKSRYLDKQYKNYKKTLIKINRMLRDEFGIDSKEKIERHIDY